MRRKRPRGQEGQFESRKKVRSISESTDELKSNDEEDEFGMRFVYHEPTYVCSEVEKEDDKVDSKDSDSEDGNEFFTFTYKFARICKKLDMDMANDLYKNPTKEQMEVSCSCTSITGCKNARCSCRKLGILCSVYCKCQSCMNDFKNIM
jgi:hypothetical protein